MDWGNLLNTATKAITPALSAAGPWGAAAGAGLGMLGSLIGGDKEEEQKPPTTTTGGGAATDPTVLKNYEDRISKLEQALASQNNTGTPQAENTNPNTNTPTVTTAPPATTGEMQEPGLSPILNNLGTDPMKSLTSGQGINGLGQNPLIKSVTGGMIPGLLGAMGGKF